MLLAKLLVVGLLAAEETRGAGPEPITPGVRDALRMRSVFGAGAVLFLSGFPGGGPGPGLNGELGVTNERYAVSVRLSLVSLLHSVQGHLGLAFDWILRDDLSLGVGAAASLNGVLSQYEPPSGGALFPVRVSWAPMPRPVDQTNRRGVMFSFELTPGVSAWGFAFGAGLFVSYAVW